MDACPLEQLDRVGERELAPGRKRVGREPGELGDVVGGLRLAGAQARRPVEVDGPVPVVAVAVGDPAQELTRLHLEPRLLAQLTPKRLDGLLALVHEASEQIPEAGARLGGAARQQDAALVVADEGADRGRRISVLLEPAGRATDGALGVVERRLAAWAVAPLGELHGRCHRIEPT